MMYTKGDYMRGFEGLPQFSKDMYFERYFLKGENYEQWLERITKVNSDCEAHKERVKDYIRNYWFHPSTPIASNSGAPDRGLPISCYVNEVEDSKQGIFDVFTENNWLGSEGGGIGTSWSNVREIDAAVGNNGKSSGIIPFIKVTDAATLAVSQGGLRRASQAAYLEISHPEIEEFIDLRRPTGDANRRALNVHHGVVVTDKFLQAVEDRTTWELISPKTKQVVKVVDAFDLWKKILVNRIETGEPYILFKDNVNNQLPVEYRLKDWEVSMSNLCSEIALHTEPGYTGVCCLGSLNLEYYDEYKDKLDQVVYNVTRFLDNVLSNFIELTKDKLGFEAARKSAMYERSLGLGVMGFHSYLQKKMIPFESPMAKGINKNIFENLKISTERANVEASRLFGKSPLAEELGVNKRNTHVTSIAPTSSISILCNATSQGIDPMLANAYIHKTNIGTYNVKNKYLEAVLYKKVSDEVHSPKEFDRELEAIWKSITKNEGSVQHLDILTDYEKDVFKTAIELNQHIIIDLASDRAPYIDQAQSVNVFIPANEHAENLYNIHMRAWKQGLKSLYYCRSTAAVRANAAGGERKIIGVDECLSCQ